MMTQSSRILGLALAAALLPLSGVHGQAKAPNFNATAEDVTIHPVVSLTEAARQYHRVAQQQAAGDAAQSYLRAGRLAYQAGAWDVAVESLERSAEQALAAGDASTAASALVDGAWISLELGKRERASHQLAQVTELLRTRAIPAGERERLEHRIEAMRVS